MGRLGFLPAGSDYRAGTHHHHLHIHHLRGHHHLHYLHHLYHLHPPAFTHPQPSSPASLAPARPPLSGHGFPAMPAPGALPDQLRHLTLQERQEDERLAVSALSSMRESTAGSVSAQTPPAFPSSSSSSSSSSSPSSSMAAASAPDALGPSAGASSPNAPERSLGLIGPDGSLPQAFSGADKEGLGAHPIVRSTLDVFEQAKQKSLLVKYGAGLAESIGRPVISKFGDVLGETNMQQLDGFARRQLDWILSSTHANAQEQEGDAGAGPRDIFASIPADLDLSDLTDNEIEELLGRLLSPQEQKELESCLHHPGSDPLKPPISPSARNEQLRAVAKYALHLRLDPRNPAHTFLAPRSGDDTRLGTIQRLPFPSPAGASGDAPTECTAYQEMNSCAPSSHISHQLHGHHHHLQHHHHHAHVHPRPRPYDRAAASDVSTRSGIRLRSPRLPSKTHSTPRLGATTSTTQPGAGDNSSSLTQYATGGLSGAMARSPESIKSLKYCLQWLQYATAHMEHHITTLRDLMVQMNQERDASTSGLPDAIGVLSSIPGSGSESGTGQDMPESGRKLPSSGLDASGIASAGPERTPGKGEELSQIKSDVVGTIRSVAEVVGKYAGAALPLPACNTVRGFILAIPARWATMNSSPSFAPPPANESANGLQEEQGPNNVSNDDASRHELPATGKAQGSQQSSSAAGITGLSADLTGTPTATPSYSISGAGDAAPHHGHSGSNNGSLNQAASTIFTLAVEYLDVLRNVTVIFGETLARVNDWMEQVRGAHVLQRRRALEAASGAPQAHLMLPPHHQDPPSRSSSHSHPHLPHPDDPYFSQHYGHAQHSSTSLSYSSSSSYSPHSNLHLSVPGAGTLTDRRTTGARTCPSASGSAPSDPPHASPAVSEASFATDRSRPRRSRQEPHLPPAAKATATAAAAAPLAPPPLSSPSSPSSPLSAAAATLPPPPTVSTNSGTPHTHPTYSSTHRTRGRSRPYPPLSMTNHHRPVSPTHQMSSTLSEVGGRASST